MSARDVDEFLPSDAAPPALAATPGLSMTDVAKVSATGESAVRVVAHTGEREQDWLLVHKLARHLMADSGAAITCTIPTYEAVLVEFDVTRTCHTEVTTRIDSLLRDIDLASPLLARPQHFRVPVLYGQEGGPDLAAVAEMTGLTPEEVIAAHTAPIYTIRCLGSPGGSPMLDGPTLPVPVPRLRSPRARVPQGAISLAGRQATLTPAVAPGGWCVIGRTPLVVLDLSAEPLVPYEPGDTLQFEAIDAAEFDARRGQRMHPEVGT